MVTGRLLQTPVVCMEDVNLTGNTNYSPNSVESVKKLNTNIHLQKVRPFKMRSVANF